MLQISLELVVISKIVTASSPGGQDNRPDWRKLHQKSKLAGSSLDSPHVGQVFSVQFFEDIES